MRLAAAVFALCSLLSTSGSLRAEPCDDAALARAGGWVEGPDAGGAGTPATSRHKTAVKGVLDQMASIVRDAYPEPVGSQAKHYRNYGLEAFSDGLAAYELVVNVKGYGCDRSRNPQGEVTLHSETATWLYVQANSVWSGNTQFETPQLFLAMGPEAPELFTIPPREILQSPGAGDASRRRIDSRLAPAFAPYPSFVREGAYDSWESSYLRREVSHVVVLSRDGSLPYAPVTIGEFLDVNESRLRAYVAAYPDDTEYQAGLLARVPELRRRLASRLGEPAHLKAAAWSESQLADPEPFAAAAAGYRLVRRASRQPTAGSDVHRPRFLVVIWRYQPEVPYSVRFHEAIRDRLDVSRLAALLAE